jgi:HlyD family secretion protein
MTEASHVAQRDVAVQFNISSNPGYTQFASKPRSIRTYWLVGIAIALLLTGGFRVWWVLDKSATVQYTTTPVSRGPITRVVTATGTVNPELSIIIGTYVSGVIRELYCDYNTVVKKGQLCAQIDPRPYQTVVDQAAANLAVAKAQLEKDQAALGYARLSLDRAARLSPTNAVSQDTFDNAKSTYDQAEAQVTFDKATIEQRQAELATAQVNLDYTNITSPVDGVVVSRNVTIGQTVAATYQTPTLFIIATDLTKMEVDSNVSESDVGNVREGESATFTIDAFPKRTFHGVVTQFRQSPQTVENVVTYDIVIGTANQDLALMPGMTAAARIVTDQKDDVIRVPNSALRYVPSGAHAEAAGTDVWVLRDGRPVAISVVLGLDDDNFTEIVKGDLAPNDKVIVGEHS